MSEKVVIEGQVRRKMMAVFWFVAPCILVEVYQTTQHYNPEDSHLHIHCHENLKSQVRRKIHKLSTTERQKLKQALK
jgi:hypothetical protein